MEGLISRDETNALKGIAILMVIVEHIGQAFNIGMMNPLGPIGVCLFLFLSGYGLSRSYQDKGRNKYFQKKIIKVYIPYVVAVIIFLIWSVVICEPKSITTALQYFVLLKLPQGSYWYLILLFYWYVVFYFLTFAFKSDKKLVLLMVLASVGIIWIKDFNRLYVWQFCSFPLGVIAAKYPSNTDRVFSPSKHRIIRGGVLILIIIFIVLKKTPYVEQNELGIADTLLQIGITLTISYMILSLRDILLLGSYHGIKIKAVTKLISLAGVVSYELYLAHVIPLDYLKRNPSVNSLCVYITVVSIFSIGLVVLDKKIIRAEKYIDAWRDKN